MIKVRQERPPHTKSDNLSSSENESLIQLIDKEDGVTLSTSIVQLWSSQKPTHVSWTKICSGVLCFIKDFTKKSYYFRLFSLDLNVLWEQEMYTPFSYFQLSKNFHYFPADDCNVGFNFAFDDEAEKFFSAVNEKISLKREKTIRKSVKLNAAPIVTSQTLTPTPTPINNSLSSQPITLNVLNSITSSAQSKLNSFEKFTSSAQSTLSRAFGKANKKKASIDKTQISQPTDFHHVGHVGIGENNFKVDLPEDESSKVMRDFIANLGVENVKANKKTEQFISNFLKEKMGADKLNEELQKQTANSTTVTSTHANITQSGSMTNTPTLMKTPPKAPALPPPPNYVPIPPPQSSSASPPQKKSTAITSPPAVSSIPPKITLHIPPPPPPLPPQMPSSLSSTAPPPPPPPLPPMHKTDTAANAPAATTKPTTDKIGQAAPSSLLAAIQNFEGFKNKPTTQTSQSLDSATTSGQSESSILDQLKNELIKRAQFLNDSDDDEDSSESDSEWN